MTSPSEFHLLTWGGLGDALLATPVFRAIKEHRHAKVIVYCASSSHRDLYRNNPHIDELPPPEPIDDIRARGHIPHDLGFPKLFPGLFYKCRAPHIIAETLGLTLTDDSLEIYLTKDEDDQAKKLLTGIDTPVALHITSSYSRNQHWPFEHWVDLVRRNPHYTFVQLGLPHERSVPGSYDLRGAVPLRVAVAVLKHCVSFVGVVSFFAHATNAVRNKGVVLYGPSAIEVYGHPNNYNLHFRMRCAPCVDILGPDPCPYGSPCMSNISVSQVESALGSQIAMVRRRAEPT